MSEVKKIATRESYGNALVELGREHTDLVVLDADLAGATKTEIFKKSISGGITPLSRRDDINKLYIPSQKLEKFCKIVFWLNCMLSLVNIFLSGMATDIVATFTDSICVGLCFSISY